MRVGLLDKLYKNAPEFHVEQFNRMMVPPLYYYIHPHWVEELYNIAKTSKRPKEKREYMDAILKNCGFRHFCSGTNRAAYACYEDPRILLKVAIDSIGMNDGPAELENQEKLKPYCTKVFDVSPMGNVSLVERVEPIISIEEFKYIAEDIFTILYTKIIGKYILQDIGTDYFMNWGIRKGFGPVLLDFPYVFDIDGSKLYCMKPMPPGSPYPVCGGEIDYDAGFNNLVCTRCGSVYIAEDLGLSRVRAGDSPIKIVQKGGFCMSVKIVGKDGRVIASCDNEAESTLDFLPKKKKGQKHEMKVRVVSSNGKVISDSDEAIEMHKKIFSKADRRIERKNQAIENRTTKNLNVSLSRKEETPLSKLKDLIDENNKAEEVNKPSKAEEIRIKDPEGYSGNKVSTKRVDSVRITDPAPYVEETTEPEKRYYSAYSPDKSFKTEKERDDFDKLTLSLNPGYDEKVDKARKRREEKKTTLSDLPDLFKDY